MAIVARLIMRSDPQEKLGQKAATVTLAVIASAILLTLSVPSQGYAQENTASVEISGQTYDISYEIAGGSVQSMTADPDTMTLLVNIDSTSNGTLTIWLPTNVIDIPDGEFAVIIDGESGNFVVDELEPTANARVLQIQFELGSEEIEIVGTTMASGGQPAKDTASVEISGQTYDISYEIAGGTVQDMTANPDTMTLLVNVDSTSSGTLTIWLPTNVMDAPGSEFAVIIDGESGNVVVDELEPTADARVLQIGFEAGTAEIEIVGTTMVPEFGAIGAVILSVAVLGVIIATITNHKYSGIKSR